MRSALASLGLVLSLALGNCSNETRITEIEPQQGTFAGGEEIVIKGKNLPRGGATVMFGRKPATNVVMESGSSLKVTSPQGDKNTDVDVMVQFDDGRAYQLKNAFRYLDATDNAKVMKNLGKK